MMGHILEIYLKIKNLGTLYIDISTINDTKPLFSINKWGKEVIVDIPWTRVILTPWETLANEKNITETSNAPRPTEKRNFSTPPISTKGN